MLREWGGKEETRKKEIIQSINKPMIKGRKEGRKEEEEK